jgi:hypothetical protein
MERTMWTDERLDDRFKGIDRRFDTLERHMEQGFNDVRAEFSDVRAELRELRQLMFMLWGPTMLGILVTIVAIVVRT